MYFMDREDDNIDEDLLANEMKFWLIITSD